MIVHLMINSLIVYIGLALFIEFILFSIRIKNSRIKYICRSLPFFKIPFDIFVFLFYGDSFFMNLNPFSCEIYVSEMIAKVFILPDFAALNEHLIIPQYIASKPPSSGLDFLTAIVVVIALGGICKKLYELFITKNFLGKILDTATPYKQKLLIPRCKKI